MKPHNEDRLAWSMLLAPFVAFFMIAGCGWLKSTSGKVADHAIDCTTKTALSVYADLGDIVRPAVVAAASNNDWGPVKTLLRGKAADLTGCLAANITTDIVKAIRGTPKTHAQQLDPDAVRAGMRAALTEAFGNAWSWKTPNGAI